LIVPDKEIKFSDLLGWDEDNHGSAFEVFLNTNPQQKNLLLLEMLNKAKNYKSAKTFFKIILPQFYLAVRTRLFLSVIMNRSTEVRFLEMRSLSIDIRNP